MKKITKLIIKLIRIVLIVTVTLLVMGLIGMALLTILEIKTENLIEKNQEIKTNSSIPEKTTTTPETIIPEKTTTPEAIAPELDNTITALLQNSSEETSAFQDETKDTDLIANDAQEFNNFNQSYDENEF